MIGQAKRTIIKGTILLMLFRIVVLLLGFVQLLILADKFGAGDQTDAYFIASSIFFLLISGMEGTFTATFVPVFIEYKEREGEKEAWAMARNLFHVLFLCCCILSFLFYMLAPFLAFLLAPGLSENTRTLCGNIMRWLSPLIVLLPLNALLMCIFYSYKRFATSSFASIFPMLGAVCSLLFLADRFGIMALPIGFSTFSFVQFLYLALGLKAKIKEFFPISLHLHAGVRVIGRLAPPRFLGFSLMRLDLMADRFFASLLGVGVVTAITYGGKIPSLTAGTIASPLMKSLIPFISTLTAHKENNTLSRIVSDGLKTISVILMPLGVFLIIFRGEIIRVVFEHGAFNIEATELTAYPLLFYSFGLVFYGFNPLLRGTFFALKDTVTPLKLGLIASCLNLLLNMLLIRFLSHGGIALATTLVALFSTACLCIFLKRKIDYLAIKDIINSSMRPLIAAVLMGFFLKLISSSLAHRLERDGMVFLVILFLMGALVYLGLCLIFKVRILGWRYEKAS